MVDLISKGNFTYKGCLGRPKDQWISTSTNHILKNIVDALTGSSHTYNPAGLKTLSLSHGCVLEAALGWGRQAELTFQG